MKDLTRIEPEPELIHSGAVINWLAIDKNHGLQEHGLTVVVRLLIHKVNELTDEVNRMKGLEK